MKEMERAHIDGLELEYELRGSGEPVVLIHWGVSALWAEPLLDEAPLAEHYALLRYHRAGFGRSSAIERSVTMADHARHCRLLMQQLDIEQAHIVGHSSSVAIALQLALDAPGAVRTLVAMDAARPAPDTALQATFRRDVVQPAIEFYRKGEKESAVDTFFQGVFGPGYIDRLEQGLPGVWDQAVSDADAFFTEELPALWQHWSFSEDEAKRITQPVLAVVGQNSAPTFPERHQLLLAWLPNVESFELPGATHLLHLQNARGIAEALASFFARHPLHASGRDFVKSSPGLRFPHSVRRHAAD